LRDFIQFLQGEWTRHYQDAKTGVSVGAITAVSNGQHKPFQAGFHQQIRGNPIMNPKTPFGNPVTES
jgi:hypothetical protein